MIHQNCRKKCVESVYSEAMVNSKVDKEYWEEVLDLIASKTLDLISFITKKNPLEEAVDAFKFYDREKWIKIIVEPQRK